MNVDANGKVETSNNCEHKCVCAYYTLTGINAALALLLTVRVVVTGIPEGVPKLAQRVG